jgi:PAS domain S-box-containing protein
MLTGDPGPLSVREEVVVGGERRWFVCRVNPVDDHEARAIVSLVDITESMRTREELDRANAEAARQALVARVTDDAVFVTDAHAVVEWVNDAFVRATGYSADEARGQSWRDLRHGPGPNWPEFATFWGRFRQGEPADVEVPVHSRDGRAYWSHIQVRPVLEDGRLVHVIGVERDVTERRRAEEHQRAATKRAKQLAAALAQEKARLTSVLSAVPQMVFWKDDERRYTGCNRAYVAFLEQQSQAEILGKDDAALGVPADFAQTLEELEDKVLATEEPVVDRAVRLTSPQGVERSVLLSVLPLRRPGAAANGIIGVIADVTETREMERHLAQANRLESIGQLAAGIAHEINTPIQFVADNTRFVADAAASMLAALQELSGLEGAVPVLEKLNLGFLAEEVPAALEQSQEGLVRVSQIVRAMKDYAHPGTGRSDTDINRAVQSTVQVARNEYKYVATLDLDLDPDTGYASCFEGELKQVVLNMIVNAAQAIEEHRTRTGVEGLGRIRISTRRVGDEVQIAISDDGPGMDEATRQRVFDPFFTTKEVGKGTGQGLSLAHSVIVAKHQGRIDLESAPGAGTTFTLHLPVRAPAPTDRRDDGRQDDRDRDSSRGDA